MIKFNIHLTGNQTKTVLNKYLILDSFEGAIFDENQNLDHSDLSKQLSICLDGLFDNGLLYFECFISPEALAFRVLR